MADEDAAPDGLDEIPMCPVCGEAVAPHLDPDEHVLTQCPDCGEVHVAHLSCMPEIVILNARFWQRARRRALASRWN